MWKRRKTLGRQRDKDWRVIQRPSPQLSEPCLVDRGHESDWVPARVVLGCMAGHPFGQCASWLIGQRRQFILPVLMSLWLFRIIFARFSFFPISLPTPVPRSPLSVFAGETCDDLDIAGQ